MLQMQTYPLSFFARLPYDIRAVIYGYLEPSLFPPVSHRFEECGFLLSCHQAKAELEEIAFQQLKAFLEKLRRSVPFPLVLKRNVNDLRRITVGLPFSAFSGAGWYGTGMRIMWKREVLMALHQLFAKYFDIVHIQISNRGSSEGSPEHDTRAALGRIELAMHGLLRDIEYIIKRVNAHPDTAEGGVTMDVIFPYVLGEGSRQYPMEHVRTRRICLTWDLRSDATSRDGQIALNGKLHQAKPKTVDMPTSGSGEAAKEICPVIEDQTLERLPEMDPSDCEVPMYYHLHSHSRLVGEMGLECHNRWFEPQSWSSNELLNGLDDMAEYFYSERVGAQLQLGLRGITEPEYCDEEAEISQALWGTQQLYSSCHTSGALQESDGNEA
jgi:hypothetical protein